MEELQVKLDKINNTLSRLPVVSQVVDLTGVKPFFLLLGFLLVSACFVAFELPGSMMLIQVIAVLYPCFCSTMALETTETIEDDKKWLTYWMVFNMFTLLDHSCKWVTNHIPFFLLIRLFIIIWLQSPTSDGALHVYRKIVKPFAQKYGGVLQELDRQFVKPFEANPSSAEPNPEKVQVSKISKENKEECKVSVDEIEVEIKSESKKD